MNNKFIHRTNATSARDTTAVFASISPPLITVQVVKPLISTTTTWTAGSGNFNTAADWSNGLPALGVDAYIDGTNTAPLTITYSSGSDTANSLTTTYTTLDLSAGTLTLQYGSSLASAAGAFSQSGGTIDFQNGESANGVSSIGGNSSAIQQTAGTIQVDQGDLDVEGNSSFAGTVSGLSGGGTLVLDSADSGATYTFASTAHLTIGELVLDGGKTTIDSGATVTVSEIVINNNATLDVASNLTYAGYFNDTSNGSNAFTLGGNTVTLTGSAYFAAINGNAYIDGPGTLVLSAPTTTGSNYSNAVILAGSASIINTSTFTQNGYFQVGDSSGNLSGITNTSTGTWDIVAGNNLTTGSDASSSFTNAGLFENTGSNTGPTIYTAFTNTGTISAAASNSIYFDNSLVNNGTIAGAGQVAITGGSATLGTSTVLSVAEFGLYNNALLTLGTNLTYAGFFDDYSNGSDTLNLVNHTLTLTGTIELGAINGNAAITGTGTLALSGATTSNSNYNNVVDIGGTATLANTGTFTQAGNVEIGDSSGGLANIINKGTWNSTTGNGIGAGTNASSKFTNSGLFENTGSNVYPTISTVFANTGTISIASGDGIAFNNILTNTGTISGAGQLGITGGTTTLGTGTVLSVASLSFSGGVLNIGTKLTYAGAFTDTNTNGESFILGGNAVTLSGPVTLDAFGGNAGIAGSGTLSLSGTTTTASNYNNAILVGGGETLSNSGAFTQGGNFQIGDATAAAGAVINTSTGTWNVSTGNNMTFGVNGSSSFANAGLFENTGSNTSPTIFAAFTNTGTISVAATDNLYFDNNLTNSGAITGAGQVAITGGVATLGSGTVLGVSQFSMYNNATLSLGTNLSYAGAFDDVGTGGYLSYDVLNLDGHTLTLTGSAELESNAFVTYIEGPGTIALSGSSTIGGSSGAGGVDIGTTAVLTNSGTVTQNYTVQIGDASGDIAGITNSATGTWKLTASNLITTGSNAASSFTNAGLLENVGSGAAPVIDALFNNTGTLEAVAATTSITLEDGGSLGGTLSGAGTIDLAGGTFTVASKAVISVASLEIAGNGTSVTFGTTTKLGTTFTQLGGTTIDLATTSTELGLVGNSSLAGTVTGTGFVAVSSTSTSSIDGLTLAGAAKFEDYGGVVNQGGQITVGNTSSSTAILEVISGSTYRITADVGISGTGSISNAGFFEKYEGNNTSTIDVLVTNTSKLEAASGTLDFAANVTNNGTAIALSGHTIAFGASLSSSTGDAGVIDLSDGGLASFGGYVGSSQTLSFLDSSISEATLSAPSEFAATIKGFGGSNALFLSGLSNVTGSYSGTTSAGTLTLTEQENGDTVTVAQLHFAGDYALDNFSITNNPGGVLIDYITPAAVTKSEAAIGAASALLPHGAGHS
jgi:hypothetical protein